MSPSDYVRLSRCTVLIRSSNSKAGSVLANRLAFLAGGLRSAKVRLSVRTRKRTRLVPVRTDPSRRHQRGRG